MTDNTHDDARLIETLRGLRPTPGFWMSNKYYIYAIQTGHDLPIRVCEAGDFNSLKWNSKSDEWLCTHIPELRDLILRQADELAALKAQLAAVTAASTNTEHADNLRGRLMAAARDVSGRHNMNYGFARLADSGLILQSSVKADSFDDAKQRLGVSRYQVWALCQAPVDGRAHVFKMSWGEA